MKKSILKFYIFSINLIHSFMKLKHFLMTFVAMLSSFTAPIYAEDGATTLSDSHVAKLEADGVTTYYDTFEAAVTAAPAGSTVTLLKNATVTQTMEIKKNLSIQLGSYDLTGDLDTPIFKILSGSGKNLQLFGKSGSKITNKGDVFYMLGNNITCYSSGTFTSKEGNVIYTRGGWFGIAGTGKYISESTQYAAIQGNGNYVGDVAISANATITSNSNVAIYWPQNGTLTIKSGTITGQTALYAKSGTITISGGTFIGNGEAVEYTPNSNGGDATGDAVVIESSSDAAYETPTVSITGGTFESVNAQPIATYGAGEELTEFVTGGTFNKKLANNNLVPSGKTTDGADGVYKIVNGTVKVTNGSATSYYATLAEAFAAVENDGTVTLLADVALDSETFTIEDGKNVNLDMAGKTITVTDNKTSGNYELFYIYGSMTVTGDGVINLTATNDRDWNAMSTIFHNRGGVLNIENGTFTHLGGTDMAYVVDNSGNYYGDATTNITGGTLTSTYIAIRNRMEQNTHGASGTAYLNISGGEINGTKRAIWAQAASTSETAPATGEINISGGNITGLVQTPSGTGSTSMTTITGGTVAAFQGEVGELTITGGTVHEVTILNAAGEETAYTVTDDGLYISAVASIGTENYATLQAAYEAAQDGETITLVWKEGDAAIAMNGAVYGKTVTITGTANVDWSKGWFFVGRGGEGDGKVIFNEANLTSVSGDSNSGLGIHVSGREKDTNSKYDGTVEIKNSTIDLDYLVNKGAMTLNNATLTVKNGFAVGGRPASETESGEDATATIVLNNSSKLVVNNHNGMGLGYEAIGVMDIDATSTFEHTQAFLVTAKGTMNVNSGTLVSNGKTLTNNGKIYFADGTKLTDMNIDGTGTAYFNNTINFYGANSIIPSNIAGTPFKLIVNKGANLLITRFVLGYDREITVYGEIEDASTLTASDIASMTPSLKFNSTSGVSVGGTGTGTLTAHDAYIELGSSSWKSSKAAHTWNFENCYVSATSFGGTNPAGNTTTTWDVTFDNSILAAKNYIKNVEQVTYSFLNDSHGTTGSLRIDGVLNIDATSSVTTTAQQNNKVGAVDEHGGINGTVNVAGTLTIGSNSKTQLEVLDGTLNVAENATVELGNNTLTLDATSTLASSGSISGAITATDGASVAISAGTYTQDVTEWCVDGFIAKANEDGTYAVTEGVAGEGTEQNPYIIKSKADLILFRNSVNAGEATYSAPGIWVVLGADIDLAGENWVGIGSATASHGFMGNFDGKGYKIKNLTITDPTADSDGYVYAGLFAVTEGTDKNNQNTIKNLTIENVTITTTGHIVSAAIAYPYYTIVDNVKVCGNIAITGGNYTAGVLAYTRRCVNASNLSIVGNENSESFVKGEDAVGGVISDIQMNGGLTAVYSNFSAENITVIGTKKVGGIAGIISGQTLDGASVKNVTLTSTDARTGVIAGALGSTSTISNVTTENVTGATTIVGAQYASSNPVEAQIGTVYYATLEEAIAAVQANETVTLLRDVTRSEILVINKSITLDGNGKTLTYTGSNRAIDVPANADATVNVTIKNLTVDFAASYCERGINYNEDGALVLEGVTVNNGATYALNLPGSSDNSEVTITNSNLSGNIALNVWGENCKINATNTTFTSVDNNEAEGYAAVKLNNDGETSAEGTVINITGGKIEVTGTNCDDTGAVYNATSTGQINVSESTEVNGMVQVAVAVIRYANGTSYTFTSIEDAIEKAQDGETVTLLRDVTISEKLVINKSITLDGNGKTLTYTGSNRAIDVPANADATVNVTIKNLTVDFAASYCERGINYNEDGALVLEGVTVNNGATYALNLPGSSDNSEVTITNSNLSGNIALNVWGENCKINATNTTFTSVDNNEAEGYAAVKLNNDGETSAEGTVINITGGKIEVTGTNCDDTGAVYNATSTGQINVSETTTVNGMVQVAVAVIRYTSGTSYTFISIEDAIEKAQDGETVTLLRDVTMSEALVINKAITLDLNGKTVSMEDASGTTAALIKNNGNLTITDGSEAMTGKIYFVSTTPSANNGYASNAISNYGTITINGGIIENATVGGACYALDNYAGSTANINGGKLIAAKTAVRIFNWTDGETAKATINMTGGEIISEDGYGINVNSGNTPYVALNISGGTITTNDTDYNLAVYVVNKGNAANFTANVTGGAFNGNFALNGVTSTTMAADAVSVSGGTFDGVICYGDPVYGFISGGTFSSAIDLTYCAAGYIPTDNGDGTYGVKTGAYVARIAGVGYETLAEAVAAVQNGETITLLADNAETVTITQKEDLSFTIDGNGKTYTGSIDVNGNRRSTGEETLTIKNVNFVAGASGAITETESGSYAHNITIEGCTFDKAEGVEGSVYGIKLQHAYNIVLKDVTAQNIAELVYANKAVTGLTADSVTVKNSTHGFYMSYGTGLVFTNVNLDVTGYGVAIRNNNSSTATFENCTINAETPIYLYQNNATNAYTLVLNGENTLTSTATDGALIKVAGEDANFKVVVNDSTLDMSKTEGLVAKIGNVYYNTLNNALAAAQDGETIVITSDFTFNTAKYVTNSDNYAVLVNVAEKAVTIDLNGKTLTASPTAEQYANAEDAMMAAVFAIDTNGNLTIIDSSEEKTGAVNVTANDAKVYSLALCYGEGGKLTLNGGNFTADVVSSGLIYSQYSQTINVYGGNYHLGNVGTGSNGSPWIFNVAGKNEGQIYVYGGTYNADVARQYWEFEVEIPYTSAVAANGDGTWSVVPAVAYVGHKDGEYTNDLGYATLQDAFNAVGEGETVTLLENITATETITSNVTATLDLNGKTIENTANVWVVKVDGNSVLTLTDNTEETLGTIKGLRGVSVVKGSELVMNNGNIVTTGATGAAVQVYGSKATMNGGNMESAYGAILMYSNGDARGTFNMTGGTLKSVSPAIYANGSDSWDDVDVTISGGKIVSETLGVYWPAVGKLTISGGEIEGKTAVYVKGGSLEVTGGTLTATGEKAEYGFVNSGFNETGDALVIENVAEGGYQEVSSVIISGGTFNSANAAGVASYAAGEATAVANFISGGTFSSAVAEAYCAEGFIPTMNEDGTYGVKNGVYVARVDGVGYETLQEAYNAVAEGGTITLAADATGAGLVINKDVTIDFNGKTYTVNSAVGSTGTATLAFQVLAGANATTYDVTFKNGTIAVTNDVVEGSKALKVVIMNYSNLTLDGMTIDGTGSDAMMYGVASNNGKLTLAGETTITVAEGVCALDIDGSQKYYDAVTAEIGADVTINGNVAIYGEEATVAITQGNFNGDFSIDETANVTITGGAFDRNDDDDVLLHLALGYSLEGDAAPYTAEYTATSAVVVIEDGAYDKYEVAQDTKVEKLTYKRTFNNAGVWQALYVPFEIPVEELTALGYEVAYFYDVHFDYDAENHQISGAPTVHIIKVTNGTLNANYPYLIKVPQAGTLNLSLEDVTLHDTNNVTVVESSSTTTKFVFAGSYKSATRSEINGSDDIPCYMLNINGEMQKIGPSVTVNPFRVSMSIIAKDGSPIIMDEVANCIKMHAIGEENEDGTTTIYHVEYDDQSVDYIYDLQGRRVLEPQKGVIYIINGKKVIF